MQTLITRNAMHKWSTEKFNEIEPRLSKSDVNGEVQCGSYVYDQLLHTYVVTLFPNLKKSKKYFL